MLHESVWQILSFLHELQMLHLKGNTFILLGCNLASLFETNTETININSIVYGKSNFRGNNTVIPLQCC